MQSSDTNQACVDGDGLLDGDDRADRLGELTIHDLTGQDHPTDPSLLDTDADGLSDGLEVGGWTVTIIWEKTKERRQEGYLVYGDPSSWDGTGAFTSTDGDGRGDPRLDFSVQIRNYPASRATRDLRPVSNS